MPAPPPSRSTGRFTRGRVYVLAIVLHLAMAPVGHGATASGAFLPENPWLTAQGSRDSPWFSLTLTAGLGLIEEDRLTSGTLMAGLDIGLTGICYFNRTLGISFGLAIQYADTAIERLPLASENLSTQDTFTGTYARSQVAGLLGFVITPWATHRLALSVTPMVGVVWQENRLMGAAAWEGTEFVAGGGLKLAFFPTGQLEVGLYVRGLAHLGGENDSASPWNHDGLTPGIRGSMGLGASLGWHF